jgi:hypothetical protein
MTNHNSPLFRKSLSYVISLQKREGLGVSSGHSPLFRKSFSYQKSLDKKRGVGGELLEKAKEGAGLSYAVAGMKAKLSTLSPATILTTHNSQFTWINP